MKNRCLCIAILIPAHISKALQGAVVEYTDAQRDEWFDDVGGITNVSTVDFTGYPDFTPVTDQWDYLGINFSGFVVTGGPSFFGYPNDGWGARGEPFIHLTFERPMQWIAADFPGNLKFQLFNNGQLFHTTQTLGGPGFDWFGGLISDTPFDQVRIYDPLDDLVFLDDLYFGPPIAVPAPFSIVVLLPILLRQRRRR